MSINKATKALITRLVASIESQRRAIDQNITRHVQNGDIERAERLHESYRNGKGGVNIRRPRKVRVATMGAAIEWLSTHKPAGVKDVVRHTTWQTNGAIDYYMQVTFDDVPAFSSYYGPEAAIMFAERVSDLRDSACKAREEVMASYDAMKDEVSQAVREVTNITIKMRHEKRDKDYRRQVTSLNGQMRRDLAHAFVATTDEEIGYLCDTARSLYTLLPSGQDEAALRAYQSVVRFRDTRKNAANLQNEVMEMTEACDEFEQKIRSGTLVAA
jgi:hypothetical protein